MTRAVGSSSASQDVSNKADADASNKSKTDQDATATQTAGDSHCFSGCGGNGQEQNVVQIGKTKQDADADAKAKQNAVNANTPVSILGDKLSGSGSSSADQTAHNKADADASNKSKTDQDATATQTAGDSKCWSGCGGNGQEQNVIQIGKTKQDADADANAKQKALNANVPLLIVGGDPSSGSSSASQDVSNKADADASNRSKTDQDATATQTGRSQSDCWSGCGGNGQEQNVVQIGKTKQHADADAKAKQKALNANVPVDISGKAVERRLQLGRPEGPQQGRCRCIEQEQDRPGCTSDAVGRQLDVWRRLRRSRTGAERAPEVQDPPAWPLQGTGTTGGDQPLDTVLKEQAPAGADRFRSDRRAAAACRSGTSLQPDAPRGTVHRRLEVCSDDDMIETTFDIRFSAGDDDCVIASNVTGETEQQAELVAFAHYVARAISLLGPARAGGVVEELGAAHDEAAAAGPRALGSRRLQSSREIHRRRLGAADLLSPQVEGAVTRPGVCARVAHRARTAS